MNGYMKSVSVCLCVCVREWSMNRSNHKVCALRLWPRIGLAIRLPSLGAALRELKVPANQKKEINALNRCHCELAMRARAVAVGARE